MIIKASATLRQNYNDIVSLCKETKEPVFLTKNGEGDAVIMDLETFNRRASRELVENRGRQNAWTERIFSGRSL